MREEKNNVGSSWTMFELMWVVNGPNRHSALIWWHRWITCLSASAWLAKIEHLFFFFILLVVITDPSIRRSRNNACMNNCQMSTLFAYITVNPKNVWLFILRALFFCSVRAAIKLAVYFLSPGRTRHFIAGCVCACVRGERRAQAKPSMHSLRIICFNKLYVWNSCVHIVRTFKYFNAIIFGVLWIRICRAEYKRFVELFTRKRILCFIIEQWTRLCLQLIEHKVTALLIAAKFKPQYEGLSLSRNTEQFLRHGIRKRCVGHDGN